LGKYGKHRPLVSLGALILALWPSFALANCRQALALGFDISGSVSLKEYRLQLNGMAAALLDENVVGAFLAMPGTPVRLMIFEWGGVRTQNVIIPWIDIENRETLQAAATRLQLSPLYRREYSTGIGQAMLFANAHMAAQSDCWRLTLDLSGDGLSNDGPRPRDIRASMMPDLTINAIVIGTPKLAEDGTALAQSRRDMETLADYFRAEVIAGPDAFVEQAFGYEEFQDTMTRKLLKELRTLAVGELNLKNQ
jgi:hypothetical protein